MLGAALASSCSDNWEPVDGTSGTGKLALSDINIANGETAKHAPSRASVVSTDQFIVTVNDAQGRAVGQWIYGQMPELIDLPVASGYTATVISHNQEPQAWEAPYYEGISEVFDINKDAITTVKPITASFSNIAVTISYSNEMKTAMGSDCKVNVVANKNGVLDFTPDETRTGYFQALPDSPTMVATFTGTINGQAVSITKTYSDVVAGNHYYINFSFKAPATGMPEETGDIYVDPETGIVIDMQVDEVAVGGNVDVEEDPMDPSDRPGKEDPIENPDPGTPDDPVTPDDPKEDAIVVTSATLNLEGVNDANSEELWNGSVVNIKAEYGVAHLWVHIKSDSQDFLSSAGDMVPFDFDLANPVVDEVDWSDKLGADGLQFPVKDQVVGNTDINFDITQFVPLLAGFPGNHEFNIEITDLKGNVQSITLKFEAK